MSAKRIVVEVPATVANCGPGFDSVGVAIDLVTRVEVILEGDDIEVSYEGPWASALADAPTDRSNLLARAFLEASGARAPRGVRFHEVVEAPVGRGLGSSASAIVAGIIAASSLGYTDSDHENLAVRLDGHPDNVMPCLMGGIYVAGGDTRLRFEPPSGWMLLLAISPEMSATAETRASLPDSYPRAEVVQQGSRAALLGAALASGNLAALFDATEDRLHQPARLASMPESAEILTSWRGMGLPAFLSGAGPSVAAFIEARQADEVVGGLDRLPEGWDVQAVDLRPEGARLIR